MVGIEPDQVRKSPDIPTQCSFTSLTQQAFIEDVSAVPQAYGSTLSFPEHCGQKKKKKEGGGGLWIVTSHTELIVNS